MYVYPCPLPPVEASKTLLSCVHIHESLSYGYIVRLVARLCPCGSISVAVAVGFFCHNYTTTIYYGSSSQVLPIMIEFHIILPLIDRDHEQMHNIAICYMASGINTYAMLVKLNFLCQDTANERE